VEAAAFHGKPVFFSLVSDWTKPDRMKSPEGFDREESAPGPRADLADDVIVGGRLSGAPQLPSGAR
jgi:hypothetical protein